MYHRLSRKSKTFIASFAGTALEFYDFTLFGLFSVTLAEKFFPEFDSYQALMMSYAVFAIGFLMRPIGGIIFGHIGDKYGRKRALSTSIFAMMVPTCLMGMLPNYEIAGMLAPILLVICRILQGLCAGGEFTSAAIFVIEHSTPQKKIFHGSLVTAASVVGMLLASFMATIFSDESLPGWAWRFPFLFSIFIGIIGHYLRKNVDESPEFKGISVGTSAPIVQVIRSHLTSALATFGLSAFIGVIYFVPFVFIVYYMNVIDDVPQSEALTYVTLGLLFYMSCIAFSGFIADRVGPYRVIVFALVVAFVGAYPIFWLMNHGHPLIAEILLGIVAGFYVGPVNGLTSQLFPSQARCTGVSISLNSGISLFGGLTPMLLTTALEHTNIIYFPAYYIIGMSVMAFFCCMVCPKNYLKRYTAITKKPFLLLISRRHHIRHICHINFICILSALDLPEAYEINHFR